MIVTMGREEGRIYPWLLQSMRAFSNVVIMTCIIVEHGRANHNVRELSHSNLQTNIRHFVL